MLDKNGREIKTGDVVRISGAYFKNDNGFYFVENSAGDPSWCGTDHCLKKISKKGKISVAKYNICFWPIHVCVSDRIKRAEANEWNREHAEIEIVDGIDRTEIANHFREEADSMIPALKRIYWDFGEESDYYKKQKSIQAHYLSVADSILKAV